jgi:exosome complex RNA-binding protein Rrp4
MWICPTWAWDTSPSGELPRSQNGYIWLYIRNSSVGQLISAVLDPSREGEERLQAAAASRGSQAEEQVRQVRETLESLLETLEEDTTDALAPVA